MLSVSTTFARAHALNLLAVHVSVCLPASPHPLQPHPPTYTHTLIDIKKRIENLIEREFLERDPNDRKMYRYLA